MFLSSTVWSPGPMLQGYGMLEVSAKLQDPRKRQPVGRIQLSTNLTTLTNPQQHVRDLLLNNTGNLVSCISINMLDDREQRSIDSPLDMPHHILAVNGDDIQVFGKVSQTSSSTTSYTATGSLSPPCLNLSLGGIS